MFLNFLIVYINIKAMSPSTQHNLNALTLINAYLLVFVKEIGIRACKSMLLYLEERTRWTCLILSRAKTYWKLF